MGRRVGREPGEEAGKCLYKGQWYPEGVFVPDACKKCYCGQGEHFCAVLSCDIAQCYDAVTDDPDHCCPFCPNGPNCRAPDGTVVQVGQEHQRSPDELCTCILLGSKADFSCPV
ncbi:hypothetical protein V1264_018166 [Littorina saxatilis]